MTKEEAKEFIPILQAFAEGKVIECRAKIGRLKGVVDIPNKWTETKEIWYVNSLEYRIKPEPELKYRPFANAEECWTEMKKHQPFGWLKSKRDGWFIHITQIDDTSDQVRVGLNCTPSVSAEKVFETFTFADGTPFGILEEEQL